MEKATENPNSETQPPPHPNHQMDADGDDENVKQLKECSSLYLALQVLLIVSLIATGTGSLARNVSLSISILVSNLESEV
ncbi:hypothetical protein IGI04_009519 [Brassica rapa subsp. trilocularis]|uniref:CASP-like protein n=1 Tax=Brassica rapa subsp. trilocularis TaxID=1813537 RepID=A0ABQ7MXK2_BRACM|nr:hypothetical protein IGI04_009519 [Brassica rapa subsp. trilocularis]